MVEKGSGPVSLGFKWVTSLEDLVSGVQRAAAF